LSVNGQKSAFIALSVEREVSLHA